MKKNSNNDSGIALLFTLILVVMFFVLGMAFMSRANFSAKMSRNFQENEEARLAANLALDNIKSNLAYNFKVNRNLTGAEQAYGYTYPAWEMKRIYDLDPTTHGDNGTVVEALETFYSYAMRNVMGEDSSGAMHHGYCKGFRSVVSNTNELQAVERSSVPLQTRHNIYGVMRRIKHDLIAQVQVDPTWTVNKTGQTAPWNTLGTDGEYRNGYQNSFFLMDKTGTVNINATKQTGTPRPGQTFTDLNTPAADGIYYPNVDLSKFPGWEACAHDPTDPDQAIFNYDALYGRKELSATTWEIEPPSSLTACNSDPLDIDRPQVSHDGNSLNGTGEKYLSYKFFTSPYSVTETFPAYTAGNYDTVNGSKAHTRYDLANLTAGGVKVRNLLTNLPYLDRWTDTLQKETVAANIIDYGDSDIEATTNYTSGSAIDPTSTYMGNGRVPYLNEICVGVINRAVGGDTEIYAKAELVWLYDGARPGTDAGYTVNFRIRVNGSTDSSGASVVIPATVINISASGLETDNNGSALPAEVDTTRYAVTKVARHTFANYSPFKKFSVEIEAVEILLNGKIIDIARLPASPVETNQPVNPAFGGTTHSTSIWAAKDPRNNTHADSWTQTLVADGVANGWYMAYGGYYTDNRDLYAVFPSGNGDYGSFFMPNTYTVADYNDTAKLPSNMKDYETDILVTGKRIKFDGSDSFDKAAIDYTKSSHCYMPDGGGFTHEIELGSISRGVDFQTLNLTTYNLDTDPVELAKAQFKPTNMDKLAYKEGKFATFYDPVTAGMCNGGDREILDNVYVTATSLNSITTEKEIYGKINSNSPYANSLKSLLMSMSIPKGTESVDIDNVVDATDADAWADFLDLDTSGWNVFPRFMTKYTYDKLAPVTATNAPSDPMRWSSKRLGSLFSRDSSPQNAGLKSPFNDREREVLLSKMKDFLTVRYTYYSGIILSESMLFKASAQTGFDQVTNAVDADDVHPARGPIYGKRLSQQQYRVEFAYDHFLDKIIVLDYKYMGKNYL